MQIPIPDNPHHIKNMASIPLLEAQGYKGMDACLATSLFEYGLIWRDIGDEFIFIYNHPSISGSFDRCSMKKDLNIAKEYDWVDWNNFYKYLGNNSWEEAEKWTKTPLPLKIWDLRNYYGVEEIFGSSYWEGFKVTED
jgi:hypothetical protein